MLARAPQKKLGSQRNLTMLYSIVLVCDWCGSNTEVDEATFTCRNCGTTKPDAKLIKKMKAKARTDVVQ